MAVLVNSAHVPGPSTNKHFLASTTAALDSIPSLRELHRLDASNNLYPVVKGNIILHRDFGWLLAFEKGQVLVLKAVRNLEADQMYLERAGQHVSVRKHAALFSLERM